MTATEVGNGLVLPYAAVAIAGKGGAVAILLITFMAVTSTLSAQVISVSSIISFDIYRRYINRNARDRDVIRWSHIGVVFFGLFSAGFSTALWYGGVNLQWTLYMLGILTCPGIFPTVFTILWRRQSKIAAVASPILGLATGLAVWLGLAQRFYGEVSIAATGAILPCVYGNVASAFSPAVYSVVLSLIFPANYDWRSLRQEKLAFEQHDVETDHDAEDAHVVNIAKYGEDKKSLKRWGFIAAGLSLATFLGHWVLWWVLHVCIDIATTDLIQAASHVWQQLCVQQRLLHCLGGCGYHLDVDHHACCRVLSHHRRLWSDQILLLDRFWRA